MQQQLSPLELGAVVLIALLAIKEAFALARAATNRKNGNPTGNSAVLQAVNDLHTTVRGQGATLTQIRDAALSAQSRSGRALSKLNRLLGIKDEEGL